MGSYDIRTATLEEKRSPEYKYLSKFYWGTRHEGNVRVVDMKDTHLSNSILFLKNKGATLTEEGVGVAFSSDDRPQLMSYGDQTTELNRALKILELERKRRNLPVPLLPYKSLEYRRKELENGK